MKKKRKQIFPSPYAHTKPLCKHIPLTHHLSFHSLFFAFNHRFFEDRTQAHSQFLLAHVFSSSPYPYSTHSPAHCCSLLFIRSSSLSRLRIPIQGTEREVVEMASYLWRKYADYLYTKWEKTFLWDMVEPYRRPKSFTPLVTIYIAAFYTGVVGAAITEQLYKEKYWEEHPGKAVPLMRPKFYWGPWRVLRGEVPPSE